MLKQWITSQPLTPQYKAQFPEIPEIVLQLLYNRNLNTQKEIDEFLYPDYSCHIHDPFLFKDMTKAVKRIFEAIDKNELIFVHGDYDADGVTSSVILVSTLKKLGAKHLDVFLPDREKDGYGINKNTVDVFIEAQAKLIISCDCGVSNVEEIKKAQEAKIDVIVTDHHNIPPTPPNAYAIIHPKIPGETYPDKTLCGAGVAFKLAQALLRTKKLIDTENSKDLESFEKWLIDLVALASVADMVPLLGESRTLTKYGLIVLNKTKRLGLKNLIEIAGLNKKSQGTLDTHDIGFQITPRINAAGRMKHANTAFQLLITEDTDEAIELARELNSNNIARQKETEQMINEGRKYIEETKQNGANIYFVIQDNWPIGLVGLIASKLYNQYYRPVLVMTKKDNKIHGSGRSIEEINIMEKMVILKDHFEKYGGHPQACGFTLKDATKLEDMQNAMRKLVDEEIKSKDITPKLAIDAEVRLDQINWELYDLLDKFAPFGQNNPTPKYLTRKVKVSSFDGVGNNGKHLRLLVKQDSNMSHKMIGFSFGDEKTVGKNWCQILKPGDELDIVFEISVNEWNGERELQKKIIDLRFAE